MRSNFSSIVVIFLLVFSSFILISTFVEHCRGATTYYVGGGGGVGNYSSIQDAIDNASNGDTIFVYNGTYYENIVVNKSLTIIGEDKNNTIINGSQQVMVVLISADHVNLSGFTIQNAYDPIGINSIGVYILANYTNVYNCIIQNNSNNQTLFGVGLYHYDGHNSSFYNNDFYRTGGWFSCDIWMYNCTDDIVYDNYLIGNSTTGLITFGVYSYFGSTISIHNNTIKNHMFGISIYDTLATSINDNTFLNDSILLSGTSLMYYNATINNNTINSKPLYYYRNNGSELTTPTDAGGLILVNCSNSTIADNTNLSKGDIGIHLIYSENISVSGCTISNTTIGIAYTQSNYNKIFYNIIINNTVGFSFNQSNYNKIHLNNFVNNTNQSTQQDTSTNTWCNESTNHGNYWDDYLGIDANGDGIGDTPQDIPFSDDQDPYPLMYERTSPPNFVWVDDDYNILTPGWNVDHFDTIQKGIDNVNSGGSIYVYNGVYAESLELYKSVNLVGNNSDGVIINGQGLSGNGINITANNTLVQGFTIKNFTFLDGFRNGFGICIYNSSFMVHNANIFSNQIYNNILGGIFINNSNCNNINMNQIYNNTVVGIFLYLSDNNTINNSNQIYNQVSGIVISISNNNTITNSNQIYNHTESGIYIVYSSENNTITNSNQIYNNYRGIYLLSSSNNSINTNQIYNNTYGISLFVSSVSSNNNNIYNNNFNNTNNAVIDETINNWNTTKTLGTNIIGGPYIGGNYWSDYTGFDTDHDGLGDAEYSIGDNNDTYPLIISPAVLTNSPTGSSVSVSVNVVVTFDKSMNQTTTEGNFSTSPHVNGVFSWSNNNKTMTFNPSSNLGYSKQYTVTIDWNATDSQGNVMLDNHSWSFTTQSKPSPGGGTVTPPSLTANAGGPYTGETGTTVSFSGSATYGSAPYTYLWNFGDGSNGTGATPTYTYTTAGTYTVTLTVTDDSASTTTATTTVTITQSSTPMHPPIADAGGPYAGLTFESITFDGSDSYDSDGSIVNYTWDFGDGSIGFGVNPVHSYNMSGLFNITLTVTDDLGLTDFNSTTANIILDSDGDGLADHVEELLGSNPMNKSDVLIITIENKTYFLVDSNNDSVFNSLYNPIGRITDLKISKDGRLLMDVFVGTEWDYFYNPLNSEIAPYQEQSDSSDDFPWLIFIIITIILIILLTLFILYKKGYIWVEKYYE